MLILTRRPGESIFIGRDIKITILPANFDCGGFSYKQIKVGIEAPENIKIIRDELLERIMKSENLNDISEFILKKGV